MYQYFSLVTFTLNKNGGAEIILEKLTKEVMIDGVATAVPCTQEEAELKLHDKISKTGGNANTQDIKCILLNTNGDFVKDDEIKKPNIVDTKKLEIDKAVADCVANPTDENFEKFKEVVIG